MAAGLGFKDFTTGEVLTAADVDGYLMQGVWVFASAAARDAAVTSPQEGNFAYLKDTNVTTYYTGSAWANLDTTGMTNPMTTTGDTIYSSSGSTPARLGIGTAGQVLTVNSGATAPEWKTASSGALTFVNKTSFSAVSSQNVDSVFTSTYENYKIIVELTNTTTQTSLDFRFRASGSTISTNDYSYGETRYNWGSGSFGAYDQATSTSLLRIAETAGSNPLRANLEVFSPQSSEKPFMFYQSANNGFGLGGSGFVNLTTAFDGFEIFTGSGNMTGSVYIYGYQKS